MGWARGSYNTAKNSTAARAEEMARSLNDILEKRHDWLPDLLETENDRGSVQERRVGTGSGQGSSRRGEDPRAVDPGRDRHSRCRCDLFQQFGTFKTSDAFALIVNPTSQTSSNGLCALSIARIARNVPPPGGIIMSAANAP